MGEFFTLLGQLFLIAIVQLVLEMFLGLVDLQGKERLIKLLGVACYVGGLYMVLRFVFNNILPEVMTIFQFGF